MNMSKLAFLKRVGQFQPIFQMEGDNTQQLQLEFLKTTEVTLSYGVDILTNDYFVMSQCTHLTDEWTDRQNSHSKTVCCIACSHV